MPITISLQRLLLLDARPLWPETLSHYSDLLEADPTNSGLWSDLADYLCGREGFADTQNEPVMARIARYISRHKKVQIAKIGDYWSIREMPASCDYSAYVNRTLLAGLAELANNYDKFAAELDSLPAPAAPEVATLPEPRNELGQLVDANGVTF